MLIIPPTVYRRRKNRKPRDKGLVDPARLVVLGIGNVSAGPTSLAVTVVVDTTESDPLNLDPAPDAAKWVGRYNGKRFVGNGVLMQAYDRLRILMTYDADEPGTDQVAYLNNPSDIADTIGRTLAAFEVEI